MQWPPSSHFVLRGRSSMQFIMIYLFYPFPHSSSSL
uniref:Uncharacterized protein n=1 Tax=Arundo donax TaxID=35708 RepID=A0A0A9HT47_ARUDO